MGLTPRDKSKEKKCLNLYSQHLLLFHSLLALRLLAPTSTSRLTQVGLDLITLEPRQTCTWGYEGELGESASYYVQGGATVVSPDGGESDTVPSGKAGLGLALTDSLGAYGEVSFVGSGDSDIDRGYGTKLGLKYSF